MVELNNNTEDPKNQSLEGNDGGEGDSGASGTNQTDGNQTGGEEMVTKAEAQKMADAMVAKKLKGMPSKEELAAFREWKESQKSDDEKRTEAEKRYAELETENTNLKHEKMVLAKGVKLDDADYVLFKVSRMEGEFEDNLEQFLTDNPKYLGEDEGKQPKRTGVAVNSPNGAKTNSVDDILKKRNPNLDI